MFYQLESESQSQRVLGILQRQLVRIMSVLPQDEFQSLLQILQGRSGQRASSASSASKHRYAQLCPCPAAGFGDFEREWSASRLAVCMHHWPLRVTRQGIDAEGLAADTGDVICARCALSLGVICLSRLLQDTGTRQAMWLHKANQPIRLDFANWLFGRQEAGIAAPGLGDAGNHCSFSTTSPSGQAHLDGFCVPLWRCKVRIRCHSF